MVTAGHARIFPAKPRQARKFSDAAKDRVKSNNPAASHPENVRELERASTRPLKISATR